MSGKSANRPTLSARVEHLERQLAEALEHIAEMRAKFEAMEQQRKEAAERLATQMGDQVKAAVLAKMNGQPVPSVQGLDTSKLLSR